MTTPASTLYGSLGDGAATIAPTLLQLLVAQRPGQYVLYHELCNFDFEDFATDGHCTLTERKDVPAMWRAWRDEQGRYQRCVDMGWFDVQWQGHQLEVLVLMYGENDSPGRRFWVVAQSRAIAESFLGAVISYGESVTDAVWVYENSSWRQSRDLFTSIQSASFEQLVLLPELQQAIRADVQRFFARRDFYEQHRIPWKRGLLLVGPPGNGKTQTLKALLKEIARPVLYVKTMKGRNTEVDGMRRVFDRARAAAPCVLVFEDLDSHIDDNNRSVFLNELDGFARNHGLLTVATTNHPDKLDRSLLERPSRFDRKFHFPLPAPDERRRFLALWNQGAAEALTLSDAGLAIIADETHGFSFAYLKELMLSATMAFADRDAAQSMDELAADTLRQLKRDLDSTQAVLGKLPEQKGRIGIRADA